MPVETIECQIVQAQLGRYLSGEAFSNEAMSQLEDHIADCSLCRQEVAVRRASLQALLGPVVSTAGRPEALIGALRESQATSMTTPPTHALVEEKVPEPATLSPKRLSKPLIYGSALALVLIGMSYIGNNPTSIFGGRAADAPASTPIVAPATVLAAEVAPAPAADPLTLDDWSSLGLADLIPYDSEDMGGMEPWEWFAISQSLSEEEASAAANEEPGLEDWELLGLGSALEKPAPEPKPATVKPRPRLRPRPRAVTPAAPVEPKNSIKIYAPGK